MRRAYRKIHICSDNELKCNQEASSNVLPSVEGIVRDVLLFRVDPGRCSSIISRYIVPNVALMRQTLIRYIFLLLDTLAS